MLPKMPYVFASKNNNRTQSYYKKNSPPSNQNEGQTNQTNQTYLTKLKLTLLAASEFPPTKTSNNPGSATNFKSEL